jgi:predicted DNA-binding antitoxin AbrB/MazE fold protein
MQRTIKAIYENGVLRPLEPLNWLPDKSTVTVVVSPPSTSGQLRDVGRDTSDEDGDMMRRITE